MSVAQAVLSTIVGSLIVALAIVLVRFNLKRRRIAATAAAATGDQLEAIYRLIDEISEERSGGFVLARTNRRLSHRRGIIAIPQGISDFPWAGRTAEIEGGTAVTFRFIDPAHEETALAGRVMRPVRIPRTTLSSGKFRNVFTPKRLLARSAPLSSALRRLCPDSPDGLLSYLLCVGRESFEFEPIDQMRIGTSPAWIQDPEWPTCPQCRRRERLIVQVPGSLLSPERKGTCYWFGCSKHPDITHVVEQYT